MSADVAVAGLTRRYDRGGRAALEGVDLAVADGECVAVLGPSGSGKSTLLRLIAGLERPDTGSVRSGGRDLTAVPPERRGMAMVAQRPLLLPHLTALDAVAFSARVRGDRRSAARAAARDLLALVGLRGFEARRPHQLSGGQQQRVALARALAAQPRVLLLDEPFSALDAELRAGMHDLLRRVRSERAPTVLLVTHDRDEATALADRIALLDAGRLLQVGPPEELYDRPRSLSVARAMGGRNEVPGAVVRGLLRTDFGDDPAGRVPDGPAVAVARQERVVVGDLLDPVAEVVAVERRGVRTGVVLRRGTSLLHAETAATTPTIGSVLHVRVPAEAVAVLPYDDGAGDA